MGGCTFWGVKCLCEGFCAEKKENGNLVICRKESSNITLAGGGASQHSDSKKGRGRGGRVDAFPPAAGAEVSLVSSASAVWPAASFCPC